jgi:hypothetical protein
MINLKGKFKDLVAAITILDGSGGGGGRPKTDKQILTKDKKSSVSFVSDLFKNLFG